MYLYLQNGTIKTLNKTINRRADTNWQHFKKMFMMLKIYKILKMLNMFTMLFTIIGKFCQHEFQMNGSENFRPSWHQ